MATCLRCDQCSAVVGEQDDELGAWWRVERYGMGWVEEPHRNPSVKALTLHMPLIEMGMMTEDPEDFEDEAEDFMDEVISSPADIALHFCSASCLGAWGKEAEAFEA